jgi:hypothetical protein
MAGIIAAGELVSSQQAADIIAAGGWYHRSRRLISSQQAADIIAAGG